MTQCMRLPELLIALDPTSPEPLHRQIYRGIREAILSGMIPSGAQLPSSRRLAGDLEVSRTTVLAAFSQLVAEGYVVGSVGSGSYVASQIPDHLLQAGNGGSSSTGPAAPPPAVSRRARDLAAMPRRSAHLYPRAFWPGVPPVDEFPLALWSKLAARRYRGLTRKQLYHSSPAGFLPLREAIVTHLASSRGVRCDAEQVIIVSSAQEALDIACRTLLDQGDAAWIEDPSWAGARGAMISAGARLVPVPVDAHGLNVELGVAAEPEARLAYVTPSHQYPLGVTLSLERRLALLAWAARQGSWILEDDYDSEFRYAGRPLTALQGLDHSSRVLYIGTFNKTVFPALRISYLVVPQSLIDPLLRMRGIGGQHVPPVEQAILTDFIVEGHYSRHLRRMRAIGGERRDVLIEAARRDLAGILEITEAETGLHTVGWLPLGMDDVAVSQAVNDQQVEAGPISRLYRRPCPRGGLVLGYAGLKPHEISAAMRRLAAGVLTVAG